VTIDPGKAPRENTPGAHRLGARVVTTEEAEGIAEEFHETYERLAPEHDYKTRKASATEWEDVPRKNRELMTAVVADLLRRGVIRGP
jgi:hypothetical protein